MPTYKNNTSEPIYLFESFYLMPGQSYESEKIYNVSGLTETSALPYYNPIVKVNDISFIGTTPQTVTLDSLTRKIKIWKIAGCTVTMYINTQSNLPGVELDSGQEVELLINNNVSSVILVPTGSGICEVLEMDEKNVIFPSQTFTTSVTLSAGGSTIGNVGINAGSNTIGKVDLNSGSNTIGKVDLNSGSNTIGKVDLNATENYIGYIGSSTVITSGYFVRPDDTTQYASGDAMADSDSAPTIITFSNCARINGNTGTITKAILVDSACQATKLSCELWLYAYEFTPDHDNDVFTPTDYELTNLVGIIQFMTSYVGDATAGAGGNVVFISESSTLPLSFKCNPTTRNLYGVLVARNAYTPVATETFTIMLQVIQD